MTKKPRVYITKGRAGHYYATVKGADGRTVAASGKCELWAAQAFGRDHLARLLREHGVTA